MKHLGYCEQIRNQFSGNNTPSKNEYIGVGLSIINNSMKFILPDGGREFDDPKLTAIDENFRLTLPFERIVLEYKRPFGSSECVGVHSSRSVICVQHYGNENIMLIPYFYFAQIKKWACIPPLLVNRLPCIDRNNTDSNGRVGIMTRSTKIAGFPDVPESDYMDELGAFMQFMNLLNCSNVHSQQLTKTRDPRDVGKCINSDSYHVLVISRKESVDYEEKGGTHASPREHVRRGHIRRLHTGEKIWINSCLVASGAAGKVFKDYQVKQQRRV